MTALNSSIASVRIAAAVANRLKASDIVAYDVTVPIAITDIMLVVTASNERQVLAVAKEIEQDVYLNDSHREPRAREGLEEAQWVLLDFGDFVVHIMHEQAREFYALDRLWRDCPTIDLRLPSTEAVAGEPLPDGQDPAEPDHGASDVPSRIQAHEAPDHGERADLARATQSER